MNCLLLLKFLCPSPQLRIAYSLTCLAVLESLICVGLPYVHVASQVALVVKKSLANSENNFLGWENPLQEGMATHSSILAWEIPWPEESGGLQSMTSQMVGHD